MRVGRAAVAIVAWVAAAAAPSPAPPLAARPSPLPEPAPAFGRVIYRAARVGGFEQTGVTMIACRHRDPERRRFAVQFFDRTGRVVSSFGATTSPPTPAGKKVLFVTDGVPFTRRGDVLNVRLGHLALGTARVVSDARVVHCVGKMRMDGGLRLPSYRDEIGLVRAGTLLPALPATWKPSPYGPPRR
ncbi:MAG: hypothetical protein IT293_13790 [Deltaproteobacteria bacterium]|nr:hypothetical protein [Deltaproteobacteria bacterium]